MNHPLAVVALALVLVSAPAIAATPTPTPAPSDGCGQAVTHDLRGGDAVSTFNQSGAINSTVANTDVSVVDATGFVRIEATNPNGYCVQYRVELSPDIVGPATLGSVDSLDGETTATWETAQNLSSGDAYTAVTVTLPARSNATFAPSAARIRTLQWTATAEQASGSILDRVTGFFESDSELKKREYTLRPAANSSDILTVRKTAPDGREISDWHATYTAGGETAPVPQTTEAPVFYTETNDRIRFMFNDDNATVELTANPSLWDESEYRLTAAKEALSDLGELLSLSIAPLAGGAGGP